MTHILEYLEQSARQFPDKPALVDESQTVTFSQALDASRRIGSSLSLSLAKGQPVAVYMEKSVANLCAFWGIVYAGGFYVSFNTQLPTSRLKQMQSVLQAPLVITDEAHRAGLEEIFPSHRILLYDDLVRSSIHHAQLSQIRSHHVDTDPLYANFTSGSTGVPKAVVVGHRSTLDFIHHFCPLFSITHEDVIANQAPFDFDVSVKDIYWPPVPPWCWCRAPSSPSPSSCWIFSVNTGPLPSFGPCPPCASSPPSTGWTTVCPRRSTRCSSAAR